MQKVKGRLNVLEFQQGIAWKMLRLIDYEIGINGACMLIEEYFLLDFGRQSGPVAEQPVRDDGC